MQSSKLAKPCYGGVLRMVERKTSREASCSCVSPKTAKARLLHTPVHTPRIVSPTLAVTLGRVQRTPQLQ